jgi:hypothetical protein
MGVHTCLRVRGRGPNSDDWRKGLALCLLSGVGFQSSVSCILHEKKWMNCDQCCGSGMFIPDPNVFNPGSRAKKFSDPGSASAAKNLRVLTESSRKSDPGWFIPDPDLDFLPLPIPGSRGQKGTLSRIRVRNTDCEIIV